MNYKDIKMSVMSTERFGAGLSLLKLKADTPLPDVHPGQFVNVLPPPCAGTLLRRPISVCMADAKNGELWMLVKNLGRGSKAISECSPGQELQILLPLGHGFTVDLPEKANTLLVGGGVGIAPLLYLGKVLHDKGKEVEFLLGGRSASDLPLQREFLHYGKLHIATEDGSSGFKGLVTDHPRFADEADFIYCCGPLPMMKAVARAAGSHNVECEVSLENKMSCGLGACLCCVEETVQGNKCTCTHGPVFNIKQLKW